MYRKVSRTLVSLCLAFCLVGLLPLRAAAWGRDGHQIVAQIALWRLNQLHAQNALNQITTILNANVGNSFPNRPNDLFDASVWPDEVRSNPNYSFAADLHFVSIPLDRNNDPQALDAYKKVRDCKRRQDHPIPEGVCIIGALVHYTKVLETSSSKKARLEALSFIVHFMGDLHQPLHTSEDKAFTNHLGGKGDRGGNYRFLFYLSDEVFQSNDSKSCVQTPNACTEKFGNKRDNLKLHAAWDKYMIQTEMKTNPDRGPNFKAYGESLIAKLPSDPSAARYAALESGDFIQWARETHQVAEQNAYALIGPKLKVSAADKKEYQFYLLNEAYREKNIALIDEQLIRAGIRLALILQRIFPDSET